MAIATKAKIALTSVLILQRTKVVTSHPRAKVSPRVRASDPNRHNATTTTTRARARTSPTTASPEQEVHHLADKLTAMFAATTCEGNVLHHANSIEYTLENASSSRTAFADTATSADFSMCRRQYQQFNKVSNNREEEADQNHHEDAVKVRARVNRTTLLLLLLTKPPSSRPSSSRKSTSLTTPTRWSIAVFAKIHRGRKARILNLVCELVLPQQESGFLEVSHPSSFVSKKNPPLVMTTTAKIVLGNLDTTYKQRRLSLKRAVHQARLLIYSTSLIYFVFISQRPQGSARLSTCTSCEGMDFGFRCFSGLGQSTKSGQ